MQTKPAAGRRFHASLAVQMVLFCLMLLPGGLRGQPVLISSFSIATNGARQFSFSSDINNYYVLYRGSSVTAITNPVQVSYGLPSTTTVQDTSLMTDQAYYRVRTITNNAPDDLDGDGVADTTELSLGRDPLVPDNQRGSLRINEVDYDQIGVDTGEFVEIVNASAVPVSLEGLLLIFINGANSAEYRRVDLSAAGVLQPGQYLVVKSALVAVPANTPTIQFSATSDNIQNGAPDGLMIVHFNTHELIDALAYEGQFFSLASVVLNGGTFTYDLLEGTPLSASVADSNTAEGSLIRWPDGVDTNNANNDWRLTPIPTPGAPNQL